MIQDIELKPAVASDAWQIAAMSRDLIEAGLAWSWTPDRIARSIRCPDTVVLVARDGGKIVGFAIMDFGQEEAHLNLLAVDPKYRRAKLGRRLIEWLETSALVAGISVVYLEVRATNKGSQAFYERIGYQKIGRAPGYYGGCEAAIRMARDLWCMPSADAT